MSKLNSIEIKNQFFTDGKKKATATEICERYNGKTITLNHVEEAKNPKTGEVWYVWGIKQDPNVYLQGGKAFSDLGSDLVSAYENNMNELNKDLAEEGFNVKLMRVELPDGKYMVKIVKVK